LSSGGLLLLAFLEEGSSFIFIVASLALLGLGFALFSSPNTNAVMSSVEKKSLSLAAATLGTMRLVGQMFSMGLALMLFALFVGKVKINPENHDAFLHSVKMGFIIFAALCFAGVFASLARGKRK